MTRAKTRGPLSVVVALLVTCLAFAVAPVAARAESTLSTGLSLNDGRIELLAVDDAIAVSGTIDNDYARQVVDIVNRERATQGLSALTMDKELTEAAMMRAAELSLYFDHTRPDGTSCFTISDRASGENIAGGSATPEGVMNLWMNSPGHRSNILGSWRSIGVGCFRVGSVTYWVQLFGRGAASGTPDVGSYEVLATIGFDTSLVPLDASGFNLNQTQLDPEPLFAGETYQLQIGIPNSGWEGIYCPIDAACLTWASSNPDVAAVGSDGMVTAGNTSGTATITATSWAGKAWSKTFVIEADDPVTPPVDDPVDDPVTPPQLSEPEDVPGYVEGENVVMWRLYNPNTGEHFYTSTQSERANLVAAGWKDEGAGWLAPIDGTPVYRLYNSVIPGGDHHYTRDKAEYDMLVSVGWTGEGIGWYSEDELGVPIYRQYNPNATNGTHNYTADASERDMLVSLGWVDEGVGWYGCR